MESSSQVIFDKNSIEFVTVAAEYCGFMERCKGAERKTFVDTALKILPLLYLKASLIPECELIGEDNLEVIVTEDDYEWIRLSVADVMGAQDDYLEFLAQTLSEGKDLPQNIIEEYKPYYKGTARPWQEGLQGFWSEFKRFINI